MAENSDVQASQDVIQVMQEATRDEIISLRVSFENRRIIVALCENDRGRFIKLTDGRSRIIVPSDGINNMRGALSALEANVDQDDTNETGTSNIQQQQQPHDDDHQQPHERKSDLIDSQRFLCEGRKFYFDILENARGRYLKISQASNRRITLIMPVNFLPYLKRAIDMVMEKAPPDTTIPTDPSTVQRVTRTLERVAALNDGSSVTINVVQREIRVMGKRIIFETAANRRGSYLKIMENNGPNRMTIVLPHSAVPDVIQLLEEAVADGDPAEVMNNPVEQNGQ